MEATRRQHQAGAFQGIRILSIGSIGWRIFRMQLFGGTRSARH